MKKEKFNGRLLTAQEMKNVKGGHIFIPSSQIIICPVCDQLIELGPYSYYIVCPHCSPLCK